MISIIITIIYTIVIIKKVKTNNIVNREKKFL